MSYAAGTSLPNASPDTNDGRSPTWWRHSRALPLPATVFVKEAAGPTRSRRALALFRMAASSLSNVALLLSIERTRLGGVCSPRNRDKVNCKSASDAALWTVVGADIFRGLYASDFEKNLHKNKQIRIKQRLLHLKSGVFESITQCKNFLQMCPSGTSSQNLHDDISQFVSGQNVCRAVARWQK